MAGAGGFFGCCFPAYCDSPFVSPSPAPVQFPSLSIILTVHLCFSASLSVVLARPPLRMIACGRHC